MDARSSKWEQALCADRRDDTFFTDGVRATQRKAARAIETCKAPCPILIDCLQYALEHHVLDGVWGATTMRQRRKMLREMRSAGMTIEQLVDQIQKERVA